MNIGITGHQGMVGTYLLNKYPNYIPLTCDVTKPDEVENCIRNYRLDGVLHLAAKSDVEFCEKSENSRLVSDVNLRGSFNVCRAAVVCGNIPVLLLSSDHIFSGDGNWFGYRENSKPSPKNVYGLSKLAAESLQKTFSNLKIVRTSYLFDTSRLTSKLEKLWNGTPQLYPTFIHRSFLYLPYFAESLSHYFRHVKLMPKILHISSSDTVSWYQFMKDAAKAFGVEYRGVIVPRKTELLNVAPRPYWGGLNVSLSKKLGFSQYSHLDGLRQMVSDAR